jgi:hypothetical protein
MPVMRQKGANFCKNWPTNLQLEVKSRKPFNVFYFTGVKSSKKFSLTLKITMYMYLRKYTRTLKNILNCNEGLAATKKISIILKQSEMLNTFMKLKKVLSQNLRNVK